MGQITDFDKLTLDVFTNGTLEPDEAVSLAAKVLSEHLSLFIDLSENAKTAEVMIEKEDNEKEKVLEMSIDELDEFTRRQCLPLFGAALSDKAADIRNAELHRSAVAIGSEGRGLSRELLDICGGELIIPMNPHSESLNAAIAASVIMWEMSR